MECQLSSSVIGGLIAGGFAILAVYVAFGKQNERDEKRQQEIIQGVLQAFYEELGEVWDQYVEMTGDFWEKFQKGKGEVLYLRISVSPDYLVIYRSNANLIGQIKDSELRRKIVRVYALLQSLVECYKINSDLVAQREKAIFDKNQELVDDTYIQLQSYALKLKEDHDRFRGLIEDLFKMLEKELSL